ncbi:MAG: hypothetical protein R3298_06270 [Gammaproteobacteria bacterium]|nr:hypothetical protein [Gammaproteobacteria bacterium]
MSSELESREIDRFNAPYGKEVVIEEVRYDNDFRLLRMRIREARRFTVIDLDHETAQHWGRLLQSWGAAQAGRLSEGTDADGA